MPTHRPVSVVQGDTPALRRAYKTVTANTAASPSTDADGFPVGNAQHVAVDVLVNDGTSFVVQLWTYSKTSGKWAVHKAFLGEDPATWTGAWTVTAAGEVVRKLAHVAGADRVALVFSSKSGVMTLGADAWITASSPGAGEL